MSKEAIELLEKALEVLSWCQENADEKWMVDHLLTVRTDIDQALSILKLQICQQCVNWVLEECTTKVPCDMSFSAFKKQQPIAGRFTKECRREFSDQLDYDCRWNAPCGKAFREALAIIDREQSINKDLVDNLKMLVALLCHPGSFVVAEDIEKAKAAIAKAIPQS